MTSVIDGLDYTKPPPGYRCWPVGGIGPKSAQYLFHDMSCWRDRGGAVGSPAPALAKGWETEAEALAAAWAHYKCEHDPPGMWIGLCPIAGFGFGVTDVAVRKGFQNVAEVRAAAWTWHDRRHALAARLHNGTWCPECYSDDAHVVALDAKATSQPWCTECDVEMGGLFEDVWPRCLAWTDEQTAEVEQWLQEPAAPLPDALAEEGDDEAGDVDPVCSRCGEACTWNEDADRDALVLCNPCAQVVAGEHWPPQVADEALRNAQVEARIDDEAALASALIEGLRVALAAWKGEAARLRELLEAAKSLQGCSGCALRLESLRIADEENGRLRAAMQRVRADLAGVEVHEVESVERALARLTEVLG